MVSFILNDRIIKTDKPDGMTLLDFVRYDNHLTGTKIGCREGDCGACTILIGELDDGQLKYRSMTSCITPLINAAGKHVVTIEGLNLPELSPVQQAMVDCGGTQCGFCTVGFVVSLYGYCLENTTPQYDDAISAIDGNICRCTGYKSIERATTQLVEGLKEKTHKESINWLVEKRYIPEYFKTIQSKLMALNTNGKASGKNESLPIVGGGTDLYVQKPESLVEQNVQGYFNQNTLKHIDVTDGVCTIGSAVTVTDLLKSESFNDLFPKLKRHLKLVSSTPIRNMGTLAGNFINASPIGDMTIFFLALNSSLNLKNNEGNQRQVQLKDFYLGYKKLDLRDGEYVDHVFFNIPKKTTLFNFEKVSKRTYLDIASVNTAVSLKVEENTIKEIHASAGGVGPTPIYLAKTCDFLTEKELTVENVDSALEFLSQDTSPISDVRGSATYKTLLLRQLFLAHFITLFPKQFEMEAFV